MDASIIIPTYNRRQRLIATLEALDSLDYPREFWEVLLVDDGSEDGTDDFFRNKKYSFQFRLFRHPSNRGRSAARNTGAMQARGRVLVFLDDDMKATPGLLRAHLDQHHGGQGRVVLGNIRHAPQVPSTALIRYLDSRGVHKLKTGASIPFRYFSAGNVSIERQLLFQAGLFDERFHQFGGEDLELGYRLSRYGTTFAFAPEALAYRFDYRDVIGLCRAMVTFGQFSLPILLQTHPDLRGLYQLAAVAPEKSFPRKIWPALKRPFLLIALLPPWGSLAEALARACDRFWIPTLLFDYLIFFHTIKGYRKFLRQSAGKSGFFKKNCRM
jgi:glycosyltransferase involved in cell wall biosynthesis